MRPAYRGFRHEAAEQLNGRKHCSLTFSSCEGAFPFVAFCSSELVSDRVSYSQNGYSALYPDNPAFF